MPGSTSSAKKLLQSAGIALAAALVLVGLRWVFRQQASLADARLDEVSSLADPSPFRVALSGHLEQIHLGILAYGQNPDPEISERIEAGAKAFEQSLHDFQQQNPRLFPSKASDAILTAFRPLASSVTQTLDVSRKKAEARGAWQADFERFLQIVQTRLRPLSRKDREGAAVRNDALLNLENQWRAWQQSLVQYWAEPVPAAWGQVQQNQDKLEEHLNFYSRVASLAEERRLIRLVQTLYQDDQKRVLEIRLLSKLVTEATAQTEALRQNLLSTLARALPAIRPQELEERKAAIFREVRWRTIGMGGLGLLALCFLLAGVLGLFRLWRRAPAITLVGGGAQSIKQEATFEMDLKGQIIGWSRAASTLYGYSEEEVRNQSIALLFASEDEIAHLYEELKSGKQTGVDAEHKTKRGDPFAVHIDFKTGKLKGQPAICLTCRRL